MKKILFATSEVHPLIKTGGLADVSSGLPKALQELGQDIRIILPNYQSIETDQEIHFVCTIHVDYRDVNILETQLPDSEVKVLLVDYAEYFDHPGNPYLDPYGDPWEDSAERFALFSRSIVEVAMNRAHLDWHADIVHCNDWQTGLVPALLGLEPARPATVFTIHNLAYQGLFPKSTFNELNLPEHLWSPEALEFHKMMSFIKGGLACSDWITTVSATYAQEIQTKEFGYGLEGLLKYRGDTLSGIVNGLDINVWNPSTDTNIEQTYHTGALHQKRSNKAALQEKVGLAVNPAIPVIGLIGRLVEQKGIDLVIDCLPKIAEMPMQFVLLGSGEKKYQAQLQRLQQQFPDKISINIGYDEAFAHLIEAGADIFLMPSRFEPCGLNQMYSLRYGTLPIVRRTGGLADTVTDSLPETLSNDSATGFVFDEPEPGVLLEVVKRALLLYDNGKTWRSIQKNAMRKDLSWKNSAQQYLTLYENLR